MGVDHDEELEHMCDECKEEISQNRCSRCGKPIASVDKFVNPNFDESRFEKLKEESM